MSVKPSTYAHTLPERLEQEWKQYDDYYSAETLARPFFYHEPRIERAFLRALIRHFHISAGATLVDIGCGNGLYSRMLSEMGLRVTAVDRSQKAIDHCVRTHGPACQWICADAFEIGPRATYDYAFCHFFTYFDAFDRPSDGVDAARSLMSLVEPGGRLFFLWHSDLSAVRLPPDRFSIINFTPAQLRAFFPDWPIEVYVIDSRAVLCRWLGAHVFNKYVSRLVAGWVYWHGSTWKRARLVLAASK